MEQVIWSRCARFLFNTYHGYAKLLVHRASEILLSREGVTQGNSLALYMLAVAISALIQKLKDQGKMILNWYADDSACAGRLSQLHERFTDLINLGPEFGYYPEPAKTMLVANQNLEESAGKIFDDLGLKIVLGQRFLGDFMVSRRERWNLYSKE